MRMAPAKSENVPLNFKVPAAFVREFKRYAVDHDLKLSELLQLAFASRRKAAGD